MRLRTAVAVSAPVLVAAALLVAGPPTAGAAHVTWLDTSLTGAAEVPGPGDPDGAGLARIGVNTSTGEICAELIVLDMKKATAAHIHSGTATVAGPVVVTLPTPAKGADAGHGSGCVTAPVQLAADIAANPASYYVNVHNAEYPRGALRGQLT